MHDTDIVDSDIPNADPAAVIRQYEPYLQRLANRYAPALALTGAVGVDDLLQAGRIATVTAQRNYDPERGSFMTCLSFYARKAMRQTLGFDAHTGAAPEALL